MAPQSPRSTRPTLATWLFLGALGATIAAVLTCTLMIDRFVRDRGVEHLAFGVGPHHCLGATLARMQIAAVLRFLPGVVAGLQVDGEVARRRSVMSRGLLTLPVRVERT